MAWDYTKIEYDKQKVDARWELERLINYGLKDGKLNAQTVKKHLAQLHIPPQRKKLLELLLQK